MNKEALDVRQELGAEPSAGLEINNTDQHGVLPNPTFALEVVPKVRLR